MGGEVGMQSGLPAHRRLLEGRTTVRVDQRTADGTKRPGGRLQSGRRRGRAGGGLGSESVSLRHL